MSWNARWNKLYDRAVRSAGLTPDSSECEALMAAEWSLQNGRPVPSRLVRSYLQVKRLGRVAQEIQPRVDALPWWRRIFV